MRKVKDMRYLVRFAIVLLEIRLYRQFKVYVLAVTSNFELLIYDDSLESC